MRTWKPPLRSLLVALILLAGTGCAGVGPRQPLALQEVVRMSQAGQPADEVIARVRDSRTTYALRGSDLHRLREAGVAPAVLDYLQASYLRDLDLLTRYQALGESLGGCAWCYPQPVSFSAAQKDTQ